MVVTDDELHAVQASGLEPLKERAPARSTLPIDELDPEDPQIADGHYYLGLALANRIMLLTDLEIPGEPEKRLGIDVETVVEDQLLQYLEANPDSDRGWSALIRAQLAMTERVRGEARDSVTELWRAKASRSVSLAKQAVPDGPELARALLLYNLLSKSWNPDAVSDDEVKADIMGKVGLQDDLLNDKVASLVFGMTNRDVDNRLTAADALVQTLGLCKYIAGDVEN